MASNEVLQSIKAQATAIRNCLNTIEEAIRTEQAVSAEDIQRLIKAKADAAEELVALAESISNPDY